MLGDKSLIHTQDFLPCIKTVQGALVRMCWFMYQLDNENTVHQVQFAGAINVFKIYISLNTHLLKQHNFEWCPRYFLIMETIINSQLQ